MPLPPDRVAQFGDGFAVAVELLNEQFAVTPAAQPPRLASSGAGREQRKRGHAGELRAPADREAVRRRDRDADSGEAPGPDADQDVGGPAAVEQFGDHRHQPFGMAAADQLVALATHVPAPSNKAAVQAALDVSKARSIRMG